MYQINTKYSKWYTNVRKIFQMVIKYINVFQSKALKTFPKVGFLVKKEPSGNPG
jgi:hypothetical protein